MDNGGLTLETEAMLNHLSEVVMGSVFYREMGCLVQSLQDFLPCFFLPISGYF